MGGRNLRRKCQAVLEYTKIKSDETPHVNICRVTEGSPGSQQWQGGFVDAKLTSQKFVLWGNEYEEEVRRCFGFVVPICTL